MQLTEVSELRLALLIAGSVFVAVLAWWEIRRSHRTPAGRPAREPVIPDDLPEMSFEWGLPLLEPPRREELPDAQQTAYVAPRAAVTVSRPEPTVTVSVPEPTVTVSAPEPGGPIVAWPPDEERQIIALRLVSVLPGQFAGHTLREALLSEGFVLGKFSIFHKPDEAGRAYLSAANLTQPGSFDGQAMNSQRFQGISLFAVLPGPKSPSDTFDDLLSTARGLNDRLEGALQDERGRPLTPLRVASLRQNLPAGIAS